MQRNQRISSRSAIPTRERLASRERESTWQNLRGRRAAHDYRYYTAKNPRLFVDILPEFLRSRVASAKNSNSRKDELRCTDRTVFVESPREPQSGAGFRCKPFKLFLSLQETLQSWPGSKLITTRRFTQMAGRYSWCHRTLGRGLEQCFPTSKYATCTQSLPWAKSYTLPRLPSD